MPFFRHTTRGADGRVRREISEAASASELAGILRGGGAIVLELTEISEAAARRANLPPPWSPAWLLPVRSFDIELGMRQLASLLRGGVSLVSALAVVSAQAQRPRGALIWRALADDVRRGKSLSEALAPRKIFSTFARELIRVGEYSGELDSAAMSVAEHLTQTREIRSALINALIYPAITILLALAVSVYLIVGVIPKIETFLKSGGATLPGVTQLLLDISQYVRGEWLQLSIIALAVLGAFLLVRATSRGREALDFAALKIPVVGRILATAGTATLARGLSTLVSSGITLLEALDVTSTLLTNRRLSRRVAEAREEVMRGNPLAEAFSAAKEFPAMLAKMTAVAETTGTLDSTLADVAAYHEQMLAIYIRRFSMLIEPAVIVITAGIVGFVYVAFFMALFSMATMM